MTEICITPPNFPSTEIFPSVDSLAAPFRGIYAIPSWIRSGIPALPSLPSMPTVPSVGDQFPTMYMPSLESYMWATGVQSGMVFSVIDVIIGALTEYISAIPLPDMPGLPFGLADLLSFNPQALLTAIRVPGFDFSEIPNLPSLWSTHDIPDIATLQALQFSSAGMMQLLTTSLLTLISSFQDYLDSVELSFDPTPSLPTIPSIGDIQAMLPSTPSIDDLLSLSFGGFPALSLTTPLRTDGVFPAFDFTTGMQCLFQNMSMFIIQTLTDYVTGLPLVGSAISSALPTVGDLVGALSFGEICYEE